MQCGKRQRQNIIISPSDYRREALKITIGKTLRPFDIRLGGLNM